MNRDGTLSLSLERALRRAAEWHRGQERRGSGVPYVQHVAAVALILDRLGFREEVVIAGLLHDAVEDTDATLEIVRAEFGGEVVDLVADCSEVKRDDAGNERPWIDRKRDHLHSLSSAPVEARAIILADKLHNLVSIEIDLIEGCPIWSLFHAERDQVLRHYHESIELLSRGDPRLETLAERCREVLARVEAIPPKIEGADA